MVVAWSATIRLVCSCIGATVTIANALRATVETGVWTVCGQYSSRQLHSWWLGAAAGRVCAPERSVQITRLHAHPINFLFSHWGRRVIAGT